MASPIPPNTALPQMDCHEISPPIATSEQKPKRPSSMTLEELETCENLNPFRDWFVKIITQANELKRSVSDQFLHEIEEMTKTHIPNLTKLELHTKSGPC